MFAASSVVFWLVLLVSLAVTAQDRRQGATSINTSPSRDQGTGGQTGGSNEPGQIIYLPPPVLYDQTPPSHCNPGESEQRSALLDKNGPQQPPVFSMSSFWVEGFTRGGWPVAIDYVLEQDSLVLVVIAPEGEKPVTYRLDGKKGHWMTRLTIPEKVGPELRIAQYSVQSLDDSVGQVSPSHIHIHGIAAGPKAVGSIGIDRLMFQPGRILTTQHQKAQYSYHSISDFDDTEVSIVRLGKSSSGEIYAASVDTKGMGSITQDHVKNGDWDGSIDKKRVSTYPAELQQWLHSPNGQYVFQVRAWLHMKHGGDFVSAISDSMVAVQ